MNKILFISILIGQLITGCSVSGEVSQNDLNKVVTCKDVRNGDVFSFNTSSITNVRVGFDGQPSFDIVTNNGRRININKKMDTWLKCNKH